MGHLIATADIGSNTAHLLIANVTENGLKRVVNESEWLSLGAVVSREGLIPESDQKNLFSVLKRFKKTVESYNVKGFEIFCTEAMRKASNHEQILKKIRKNLGIPISIIPPDKEAELSYYACQLDTDVHPPFLMLEAGGGSVQAAYCTTQGIKTEISLPIGTGVLSVRSALEFPSKQIQVDMIREIVQEECEPLQSIPGVRQIVACGGVIRGLWRALHPDGNRDLHIQEIEYLEWAVSRLTIQEIVERFGVKLKRAETLLPGCIIAQEIMAMFACDHLTVSQFGVREGAVLEKLRMESEKIGK